MTSPGVAVSLTARTATTRAVAGEPPGGGGGGGGGEGGGVAGSIGGVAGAARAVHDDPGDAAWALTGSGSTPWDDDDWSYVSMKTKVQSLHSQINFLVGHVSALQAGVEKRVSRNDLHAHFVKVTQAVEDKLGGVREDVRAQLASLEAREERFRGEMERVARLETTVETLNARLPAVVKTAVDEELTTWRETVVQRVRMETTDDLQRIVESSQRHLADFVRWQIAYELDRANRRTSGEDVAETCDEDPNRPEPVPVLETWKREIGEPVPPVRSDVARKRHVRPERVDILWKTNEQPEPSEREVEDYWAAVAREEERAAAEQRLETARLEAEALRLSGPPPPPPPPPFTKDEIMAEVEDRVQRLATQISSRLGHVSDSLTSTLEERIGELHVAEVYKELSVVRYAMNELREADKATQIKLTNVRSQIAQAIEQGIGAGGGGGPGGPGGPRGGGPARVGSSGSLLRSDSSGFLPTAYFDDETDVAERKTAAAEYATRSMLAEVRESVKRLKGDLTMSDVARRTERDALEEAVSANRAAVEAAMKSLRMTRTEHDADLVALERRVGDAWQRALDDTLRPLEKRLPDIGVWEQRFSQVMARIDEDAEERFVQSVTPAGEAFSVLEDELKAEREARKAAFDEVMRVLMPFRRAVFRELAAKVTWADLEASVGTTPAEPVESDAHTWSVAASQDRRPPGAGPEQLTGEFPFVRPRGSLNRQRDLVVDGRASPVARPGSPFNDSIADRMLRELDTTGSENEGERLARRPASAGPARATAGGRSRADMLVDAAQVLATQPAARSSSLRNVPQSSFSVQPPPKARRPQRPMSARR